MICLLACFSFICYGEEAAQETKKIEVEVSVYKGRRLVPDVHVSFYETSTLKQTIRKMDNIYNDYLMLKERAKNLRSKRNAEKAFLKKNKNTASGDYNERLREIDKIYVSGIMEINKEIEKVEDNLKKEHTSCVNRARVSSSSQNTDSWVTYQANKNGQFVATFNDYGTYVVMVHEPLIFGGTTCYVFYEVVIDNKTKKLKTEYKQYAFEKED